MFNTKATDSDGVRLIDLGNPLVSVVIPSYNVVATLGETVESLLMQTYSNLEVIIVNDCSTDATGALADSLARTDARIKVVHKPKNEDLNFARATGFAASTGDFITFIDADDVYTNDAIEVLLSVYQSTKADISMAGYLMTDPYLVPHEPRVWPSAPINDEITVYSHYEMLDQFLRGFSAWGHNNNPDNAVCKLFRREVLEGLDWGEADYRVGEDTFFSLLTFIRAQNSAVTNRIIYHCRVLENSKSRPSNWKFQFKKEPITALQLIDNLAKLAESAIPMEDEAAVGRLIWRISRVYQNAADMEIPRSFLAVLEENNREWQERLHRVEQENQQLKEQIAEQTEQLAEQANQNNAIYTSRTWRTGRVVLAPARALRGISKKA